MGSERASGEEGMVWQSGCTKHAAMPLNRPQICPQKSSQCCQVNRMECVYECIYTPGRLGRLLLHIGCRRCRPHSRRRRSRRRLPGAVGERGPRPAETPPWFDRHWSVSKCISLVICPSSIFSPLEYRRCTYVVPSCCIIAG